MRSEATALDYKNHLETQCEREIRVCLFLLCFNGVHMSAKTKLQVYERNRGKYILFVLFICFRIGGSQQSIIGILPKGMKRRVVTMMSQVARVKTFEDVFLLTGLAPIGTFIPSRRHSHLNIHI